MSPTTAALLLQILGIWRIAEGRMPLAILGDRPLGSGRDLAEVPLVLVPSSDLALYSNVHISSVSRSQPLVTCNLQNSYSLDATPAVRVLLRRPIVVPAPGSVLPFPSHLSVLHEGLRVSLPVGALIAPTAGPGPQVIRVMYAIPSSPLSLQYPYYAPLPLPHPFRPSYVPSLTARPSYVPSLTARPSPLIPIHPVSTTAPDLVSKRPPGAPLVTVLDFPSELASPESLYYQPPLEDELGNRNPPEAIVPAGIVQSAQPRPSLQLFINSKESPLLQTLRDEAITNRLRTAALSSNSVGVEAV